VRLAAKQVRRVEHTGQPASFPAHALVAGPPSVEEERAAQLTTAGSRLRLLLRTKKRLRYKDTTHSATFCRQTGTSLEMIEENYGDARVDAEQLEEMIGELGQPTRGSQPGIFPEPPG
jgi:hypothetical protein